MEARQHRMHHVFSAQHICATDFFLKIWHNSIDKGILQIFHGKY